MDVEGNTHMYTRTKRKVYVPKTQRKKTTHTQKNFQPRKKESDGTEQQQTYTVWTVTVAPLHQVAPIRPKTSQPKPNHNSKISHNQNSTNKYSHQPTNQPTATDSNQSTHPFIQCYHGFSTNCRHHHYSTQSTHSHSHSHSSPPSVSIQLTPRLVRHGRPSMLIL